MELDIAAPPPEFLRRYTDLPALIYLLKSRRLTLLNPNTWDDKNDSHYLELYKAKKDLSTVLALCFTAKTSETYHHWRVFSPGNSGVCIKFDGKALIDHLQKTDGIRCGPAQYKLLDNVRNRAPALNDLPFMKRRAFRDENEYRVIYEQQGLVCETKDIEFPLSTISKITLNPWAHITLQRAVMELIKEIDGCGKLKVGISSLINNSEWKRIGAQAA